MTVALAAAVDLIHVGPQPGDVNAGLVLITKLGLSIFVAYFALRTVRRLLGV